MRGGLKPPLLRALVDDMLRHLYDLSAVIPVFYVYRVSRDVPTGEIRCNRFESVEIPRKFIGEKPGGEISVTNQSKKLLHRPGGDSANPKLTAGHPNQWHHGEIQFVGWHGWRF
jgi:hypothetical protein